MTAIPQPSPARYTCGTSRPWCLRALRLDMATWALFFHPVTTSPSPFSIASKPALATSAGSSFSCVPIFVSSMSARAKNSVSVPPGCRQVTVTRRVLEFVADRGRKAVDERLGAMVDGLEGAGHVAGDRAGNQDAPLVAPGHLAQHLLHEVDRAGDVGVDHVLDVGKVLLEKAAAKAVAGIGKQRIDRPALRRGIEPVDARQCRQVNLLGFYLPAERAQFLRRLMDLGSSAAISRSKPFCAHSFASSRPMPLDAPVTMANKRPFVVMVFTPSEREQSGTANFPPCVTN